ncbi:MAG TPA: HlyD family efflux transporter periplasmic adaptor subunit [Pirellulales bacterium]|nr:HlyD family efflux transporter periplasmic adaptor subunit [Pirellulales bacterium]
MKGGRGETPRRRLEPFFRRADQFSFRELQATVFGPLANRLNAFLLLFRRASWVRGGTVVAGLLLLIAGGWRASGLLLPAGQADLIVERAKLGTFVHDVVERGEVESSANVNVSCEVQSQNAEGVRIIDIVPEGTMVKAGDFLVKLDDAKLSTDRATQQIAVNTAAAALSQAEYEREAQIIAKQEYELGKFNEEEAKLESELLVAEENIRRAKNVLKYSKRMAARGYIDRFKLEADQFGVAKYEKELRVAQVKLDVLRNYTKIKTVKELESKIKISEAKVKSEGAKHQIELDKLAQIESQLEKCTIKAPIAGQVVYAEIQRWRSNGDDAIRAGTRVREQQVIIRLPDPKKMQVKARISEARVDRVKAGMKVKIELDALPGLELHGQVKKVNPYPSDDNWFSSNVKEYATFIEILDPPNALRPGMSAHVAIRVETQPAALQVPVQAVVQREGKFYCLVRERAKLAAREVLIGASNEKFLVIRDGLTEGQEVAMNPRAHLDEVGLPAIDVEPTKLASQSQLAGGSKSAADAKPAAAGEVNAKPEADPAKEPGAEATATSQATAESTPKSTADRASPSAGTGPGG